jgi:hypothetical protein
LGCGVSQPFAKRATMHKATIAKNGTAEARFMSIPAEKLSNGEAHSATWRQGLEDARVRMERLVLALEQGVFLKRGVWSRTETGNRESGDLPKGETQHGNSHTKPAYGVRRRGCARAHGQGLPTARARRSGVIERFGNLQKIARFYLDRVTWRSYDPRRRAVRQSGPHRDVGRRAGKMIRSEQSCA